MANESRNRYHPPNIRSGRPLDHTFWNRSTKLRAGAARPARGLDRQVEGLRRLGQWPDRSRDSHLDARVDLVEPRQLGHDPVKRFAELGEQDHLARAAHAAQVAGLGRDALQRPGDHPRELATGRGQMDGAIASLEQLRAQVLLEGTDLAAHRRLGQMQLLGGPGEAFQARRRLEGQQAGQGR